MDVKHMIVIMMSAVFVNNYVLSQFLGMCPFLGVSKEIKNAAGMSGAVMFVMLIATAATWPIQHYILHEKGLDYLQTVVFILVIAALVQLTKIILKRYIPPLHDALGVFLPLMVSNCVIFGVTITNINNDYTFFEAVVNALGAGGGFFLAMILFSGIREHTQNADPPPSFKGIPLTLISAAILSLSFFAFGGVVENLFGH
ncbi:MAG: RnfABCDGE type electron transport complex subunit A [Oscillospiraceae bacterium]|nr:RnfABCDGE type electron transport complex subunit A [Oscillospiraceae bacterium]